MTTRPPYLRDTDRDCLARFNVPGPAMTCELLAGHDGLHKHVCTRWSDAHSMPAPAVGDVVARTGDPR